jgi:fibronectin type 3 domain-containing protein
MPLDEPQFSSPVEFGREACFRVRAVRVEASGERIEGEPSERACVTPRDTFAPAAPVEVFALSGDGEITIMWLPNAEPDLAGYLILRGTTGDDTLLPITPSPQTATRFVDTSVTPGVRYVYAVVAVDAASNRSAPSARDEAAAR